MIVLSTGRRSRWPALRRSDVNTAARMCRSSRSLLRLRAESICWLFARSGRLGLARLLSLDAFVNLFPMHRNIFRGIDPNAHLTAFDAQNGDGDLVADHDGLADSTREDKHAFPLALGSRFDARYAERQTDGIPNFYPVTDKREMAFAARVTSS